MRFFFFLKKKQKYPFAFSLESQLNAPENKPRTIHRLEKLEPSLWVLHEGDTAPSPAFSQLSITVPLFLLLWGRGEG